MTSGVRFFQEIEKKTSLLPSIQIYSGFLCFVKEKMHKKTAQGEKLRGFKFWYCFIGTNTTIQTYTTSARLSSLLYQKTINPRSAV